MPGPEVSFWMLVTVELLPHIQHISGLCLQSLPFIPKHSPSQLSSSYPKENPKRLPKYCANANYILTLLLDAYKFNETTWNNIIFQMKVGSAPSP